MYYVPWIISNNNKRHARCPQLVLTNQFYHQGIERRMYHSRQWFMSRIPITSQIRLISKFQTLSLTSETKKNKFFSYPRWLQDNDVIRKWMDKLIHHVTSRVWLTSYRSEIWWVTMWRHCRNHRQNKLSVKTIILSSLKRPTKIILPNIINRSIEEHAKIFILPPA